MNIFFFSSISIRKLRWAPGLAVDRVVGPTYIQNFNVALDLVPLCQVITSIGMLGYGFEENLIRKVVQDLQGCLAPNALLLGSGSTDEAF